MNIILCGLPMSGKTTLGNRLAKQLGWTFVDTDRLIETAYASYAKKNSSCRDIYLYEGAGFFRELEKKQIFTLKNLKQHVIATGGGTLLDTNNALVLKEIGNVIYLKSSPHILWERLKQRHLLAYLDSQNPEKSFYVTAKQRIPIYEETADFVIDTGELTEEESLQQLMQINYGQ